MLITIRPLLSRKPNIRSILVDTQVYALQKIVFIGMYDRNSQETGALGDTVCYIIGI